MNLRQCLLGASLVTATVIAPPLHAADCRPGLEPAATLLMPYFEVDLDNPAGVASEFHVTNSATASKLVRFTLWTDWGIPTLAFDVVIPARGLQRIDLRDVFTGTLPVTSGTGFPDCTSPLTNPRIGPVTRDKLLKSHTGQPLADGLCRGSNHNVTPGTVRGYLTADVLNRCSATIRSPRDFGYFVHGGLGVASNDNVLTGDFLLHVPGVEVQAAAPAVHITADGTRVLQRTFYEPELDGVDRQDDRLPLPDKMTTRFTNLGAFADGLASFLWTEPLAEYSVPSACGASPLPASISECGLLFPAARNAAGGSVAASFDLTDLPYVTRLAAFPGSNPGLSSGTFRLEAYLYFGCNILPPPPLPRQMWWVPVLRSPGGPTATLPAFPESELCELPFGQP